MEEVKVYYIRRNDTAKTFWAKYLYSPKLQMGFKYRTPIVKPVLYRKGNLKELEAMVENPKQFKEGLMLYEGKLDPEKIANLFELYKGIEQGRKIAIKNFDLEFNAIRSEIGIRENLSPKGDSFPDQKRLIKKYGIECR